MAPDKLPATLLDAIWPGVLAFSCILIIGGGKEFTMAGSGGGNGSTIAGKGGGRFSRTTGGFDVANGFIPSENDCDIT